MTQKRTSAKSVDKDYNLTIITLDGHLGCAAENAFARLKKQLPNLSCSIHVAGEWGSDDVALDACIKGIKKADIVIVCMLFMEDHIVKVLPTLKERQKSCDAMLCFMCAGDVMKLTRMGRFTMDGKSKGPLSLLKRLRGSKKSKTASNGAKQVALLRRLPRILKFIPGTAQDLRAYFLAMQYWLAGSEENIRRLISMMVARYGPNQFSKLEVLEPLEYPETGVYHPGLKQVVDESAGVLAKFIKKQKPTVGLLLMRSYILAGNTAHYDALIKALEAKGLNVLPVFASGLDARPAIDQYFLQNGKTVIDGFVSLTGFSLVGGPAYNDSAAAVEKLKELNVPCIAAHASEFQSLEAWAESDAGLLPVETTMMVAIPELDGAIVPTLFGGRSDRGDKERELVPAQPAIDGLVDRVARMVGLRTTAREQRRLAIVLFNFPPNAGATGTAAHLSVFKSLYNTLQGLKHAGYEVELPQDSDDLANKILKGNAQEFGSAANVHAQISADDYVSREPWLTEIENEWGPAPGKHQSDGKSIHVLGCQLGQIFVGVQPAFGYEGDPLRMLFDKSLTPTHAFTAFYRYIREDFDAHAVLHFGTHGALEFMPGKQSGLSQSCWPQRLIGDLPNYYLYAANNPSEGTLAKRRGGATLISYLTPSVTKAGLYRELSALQDSINRFRGLGPETSEEKESLFELIVEQAQGLELPIDNKTDQNTAVHGLYTALLELENALIPDGLHVVGEVMSQEQRHTLLRAMVESEFPDTAEQRLDQLLAAIEEKTFTRSDEDEFGKATLEKLATANQQMQIESEVPAIVSALDGNYVPPVSGGDLLRSPDILPTGRNLHGFDPFKIPSAFALRQGKDHAQQLLDKHQSLQGELPESIAMVLWGSDNLKSEGAPIGQALHLLGAKPRLDAYGKLCGAELISLEELGRPRIDVLITLSGIFRDLLPFQTQLLAEAAWLAASADEPLEMNFVRKHVLEYQKEFDCDLETAALRVYSNAVGAYGSNVNHVIENGHWNDDSELVDQFSRRKCFAYGRDGQSKKQEALFQRSLKDVSLAYQNLESAELGVTSIDHYFDTLGGISKAAELAKGESIEVYIGDQTGATDTVRTLADQVALEARTRMLNPRWYEGMLEHGYEGVKQIENHVTNTLGWSATTGRVAPWVYQQISETFLLDEEMRERLAALNPMACAKVAVRLLEARDRNYWQPDEETLAALEHAGNELEDRLEGVAEVAA